MALAIDSSTVSDEEVWCGVNALLDDYIGISHSDIVIVGYTPDSREAVAWVRLALDCRTIKYKSVHMQPLRDSGFRDRFLELLPSSPPQNGRLIILLFERDTISHNEVIKEAICGYDNHQYFVVRSINSDRHLFAKGLSVTPKKLTALNTAILERCISAKKLRIITPSGTDLSIELDSKYRWVSNKGTAEDGKFLIIPCGEVATFPSNISGTLVADFAINVNTMLDIDARLNKEPVFVNIDHGELISFQCENIQMSEYLGRAFSRQNATRVGELGIGTNIAVDNPIYENSHLNERCPGVHIGFGQHNQDIETAGYFCDIHIDLIAKGGLIWVDDEPDPIDLANLQESKNSHPHLILCEDIFSTDDLEGDCCGIATTN